MISSVEVSNGGLESQTVNMKFVWEAKGETDFQGFLLGELSKLRTQWS